MGIPSTQEVPAGDMGGGINAETRLEVCSN